MPRPTIEQQRMAEVVMGPKSWRTSPLRQWREQINVGGRARALKSDCPSENLVCRPVLPLRDMIALGTLKYYLSTINS